MPGKRRRSSIAADSSPARSNAARIAAASASVTMNMTRAWNAGTPAGKHGVGHSVREARLFGGQAGASVLDDGLRNSLALWRGLTG